MNIAIQQTDQPLEKKRVPVALKMAAWFFSIVFHPLFIPTIACWFLIFVQPGILNGVDNHEKGMILIRVAYITIFYPALTVLLLKAVGFAKSIYLKTQRERIIPYVATNIFYFWLFLVFKNQEQIPVFLTSFVLGIFLASSLALIANSYFKISMHALGMGALSGIGLVLIFSGFPYMLFLPLMLIFLITGLVCTCRLIISDHTPFDIYAGLLFAIICQFVAFMVMA
ncbi:MAG: hypothetical protein JSS98_15995 [Bacteroidetes bacterium]|nr:hypothetical protein [Bacteroidota bacterium]